MSDTDDPHGVWDMPPADDRANRRADFQAFGAPALGVVLVLIAILVVSA